MTPIPLGFRAESTRNPKRIPLGKWSISLTRVLRVNSSQVKSYQVKSRKIPRSLTDRPTDNVTREARP